MFIQHTKGQLISKGLFDVIVWTKKNNEIFFRISVLAFSQMLNFDFSIMKKLWDLANEKLANIRGGHGILDIHGCQIHHKVAIYVVK